MHEKNKVLTYFRGCPKGDEVTNLKLNAFYNQFLYLKARLSD